ncbi:MAG TPA: MFS transporter [Methylomirabilota bacterium]|jgi:MFS family permease|nr:MFS transporter [Methylomirabilota bacterium]
MSDGSEATGEVGRLASSPRPVRLGALRHRDFRLFWIGQLISQIGTWMQSVAQAWLVLELTHSPLHLGIVSALQFTPVLFLSPVGGVLSDRFAKRKVLLISQTAMQLQAFVLAALVWSGRVEYWHVAVLAAVYGLSRAIDIPARQSYITDLVGRSDLPNAVALNSVVMNGARIVGPAVAGLLIAAFGVALAFLLNGVSFVAVLVALVAIRTEGRPDVGRLGIREGVLSALNYAAGTPPVAFTLGLMVVVSLLVLNFNVIVPLVARNVLNQDAHGFGLLMSSLGAGAVAGAFGVALFRRGQPPLAFLVASGALLCAGLAALAAVSHFFLAALVLALLGCCQILFTTGCNTTLQLIAPNELRGRVMGLYTVTFAGMTPFGSLLIGWVAEHQGIRMACAAGGAIGLLGVAVLVLIGYRGGIAWTHGRAV